MQLLLLRLTGRQDCYTPVQRAREAYAMRRYLVAFWKTASGNLRSVADTQAKHDVCTEARVQGPAVEDGGRVLQHPHFAENDHAISRKFIVE